MKLRKNNDSYFLRLPKNIINFLQLKRTARAYVELHVSQILSDDNINYINVYALSAHITKKAFDFDEPVRSTMCLPVAIRYVRKLGLVPGQEVLETLSSQTATHIVFDLEISSKIPKEKHFLTLGDDEPIQSQATENADAPAIDDYLAKHNMKNANPAKIEPHIDIYPRNRILLEAV